MIEGDDLELFERSLRHATETATGAALDTALGEVGWHDALGVDRRAAVSILFELQGRANATSSALDAVACDALGVDAGRAVVLPPLGCTDAPATAGTGTVSVRGLGSAALGASEVAVVVAGRGDEAVALEVPTRELSLRPVQGVDPAFGLLEVTGEVRAGEIGPVAWHEAVSRCQLAVGHELAGASRKVLELAREHALERIQFGVPIASFQAVRHRLAETLVAIEMATGVLDAAWDDGAPHTAAMAKALAGRGGRTAGRHCQQVLAGIGFTLEHPFHRYFRRMLVLDELFGSARTLTRALGEELLRSRRLPPVLPL